MSTGKIAPKKPLVAKAAPKESRPPAPPPKPAIDLLCEDLSGREPPPVKTAETKTRPPTAGVPPLITTEIGLSFIRGKPIAVEVSPTGEALRIIRMINGSASAEDFNNEVDPVILLGEDWFRELRTSSGERLTLEQLQDLVDAIKAGELPDDEELEECGHTALEAYSSDAKKHIELVSGHLQILPDFTAQRECYYISGPSGCGKSTIAAQICEAHREMDEKKPIFLFSRVSADPAFKALGDITVIPIDAELVRNPTPPETFKGALVIFDDIDTILDKKQNEACAKIRSDLLETGRHLNATCICTSHLIVNWGKTRTLLNEATAVVLFPGYGAKAHIARYLESYAGLTKKQVERAMALKSRWLLHYRHAPQYLLYETGAMLLDAL